MDDRIDALDIRLIHLEDLVSRLNLVVTDQQGTVNRINQQMVELRNRIIAVEEGGLGAPEGLSVDPPTGFNR